MGFIEVSHFFKSLICCNSSVGTLQSPYFAWGKIPRSVSIAIPTFFVFLAFYMYAKALFQYLESEVKFSKAGTGFHIWMMMFTAYSR
jgi:hypothetical protein